MKKQLLLLCALLATVLQSASAAPVGWYNLSETWRDGYFSGQFYYDSASPYKITQVKGSLTDLAQTTAITTVWNVVNGAPEPWVFLANGSAADPHQYDAGFYINLIDLGAALAIDMSADNGLYDFSSDFAFYTPDRLDDSPLISWSITQAVPEPASIALFGLGLLGCMAGRRRT